MMTNCKLMTLVVSVLLMAGCMSDTSDAISLEQTQNPLSEDNAISFGSYLRSSANGNTTRAGSTGGIDNTKLKDDSYGFGVFAYFTGTADYAQTTQANFMYNQEVKWKQANKDNGYVTEWEYAPLKYWPNEVQNGSVDDQNNDAANDPATGSSTYGGNVSFFAYAPYVALPTSGSIVTTDGGITAINGKKNISGNADSQDPTIEYTVPADGGKVVDLLWGTRGETSVNVVEGANAGRSYNAGGSAYEQAILPGYSVNADLTKQKTTGMVNFLFKHALSKVGGSTNTSGGSSSVKNGLMIVLDIDNLLGSESGGELEAYKGGTVTERTQYNTKVTVSDITLVARSLVEDGAKKPGDEGYTPKYLSENKGTLNLATGKWSITGSTTTAQASAATTYYAINNGGSASATLSDQIAEITLGADANTKAGFEALPLGVTTEAQNVYANEANPLVFIPGTYPELTVSVTYTVRTYDEYLSLAYSEVTQRITKKLTFTKAVELNKQYSLLMHLGLNSIKFTASVSDWDRTLITGEDAVGNKIEEDAIEHIYIPRNVGENAPTADETPAATLTIGGEEYMLTIQQIGIPAGGSYFDSDSTEPIVIKAYKKTSDGWSQIALDGSTNSVTVVCRASTKHFHQGTTGEYTYTGTPEYLELRVQEADKGFCHAPVDITLKIGDKSAKANTTINIWPNKYLPY